MLQIIFCFFTFLTVSLSANEDAVSSPEGYHGHSKWQKFSAEWLIDHYPFQGNESVLDLCCGDGKISQFISEHLPEGHVVGIDRSAAMIAFALSHYLSEKVRFVQADAREIAFLEQFDLITSFTAMHLIPEQVSVLNNVASALKPGGHILFQFPIVSGFGTALDEVLEDASWKPHFKEFSSGWNFFSKEQYAAFLDEAHLVTTRLEMTRLEEIYPTVEEFKTSISFWLPHLRILPENQRQAFLNNLMAKYIAHVPLDDEGRLHYFVERLEVEAVKP